MLQADHFDQEVRQKLLRLGPAATELLQNYATGSHPSGDPDIQGRAVLVLGEGGDRGCVPILQKALRDPDSDIRLRVLRAMGRLGGSAATDAISAVVAAKGTSDVERAYCIRSLAMIKSKKAKEALRSIDTRKLSSYVRGELRTATKGIKKKTAKKKGKAKKAATKARKKVTKAVKKARKKVTSAKKKLKKRLKKRKTTKKKAKTARKKSKKTAGKKRTKKKKS